MGPTCETVFSTQVDEPNPKERHHHGKKADIVNLEAESWLSPLSDHSTQAAVHNQPGL